MKRIEVLFGVLKVPLHFIAAMSALLLAYTLREANIDLIPTVQLLPPASTLPPFREYIEFSAWAALLYVLLAASFRLYLIKITLGPWKEIGRILVVSAIWFALIVVWYALIKQEVLFSRFVLIQSAALLTLFVLLVHTFAVIMQRMLLRLGIGTRHIVSLGNHDIPEHLRYVLLNDPRFRYVGHVNSVDEFRHRIAHAQIDVVLHSDPHLGSDDTASLIDYCRSHHIGYTFLPPVFLDVPQHLAMSRLGMVPILSFEPTPLDGWGRVFKRLGDFSASIALIVVFSPLFLLISFLTFITMGWPILYVSRRVGQQGEDTIPVLKFRTMRRDADAIKKDLLHLSHRADGPLFKIKNDPRVTPLGRILRRLTLDELPQIFNVCMGHMSLVGPRPHLPEEVDRYSDYERRVFTVKPGMTGLAQISGRSDLTFKEEIALDMRYVEEWSPLLDVWILWRTAFVVLSGKGAD